MCHCFRQCPRPFQVLGWSRCWLLAVYLRRPFCGGQDRLPADQRLIFGITRLLERQFRELLDPLARDVGLDVLHAFDAATRLSILPTVLIGVTTAGLLRHLLS